MEGVTCKKGTLKFEKKKEIEFPMFCEMGKQVPTLNTLKTHPKVIFVILLSRVVNVNSKFQKYEH